VTSSHRPSIDFDQISRSALQNADALVSQWLPHGHRQGTEWVARNPLRHDQRPGSFKINLRTGRWADFATGDSGGDLISLAAYLSGCSQGQAAQQLAEMLGVSK